MATIPSRSASPTRRDGYVQGWLVGLSGDDAAGLVPFEVAAVPGNGRRTWSGPVGDDLRASFELAAWAVELTGLSKAFPMLDVHVNLPLHHVTGSGPSCRLSFANALLQAQCPRRGLPAPTTALIGDLTLGGDVLPVGGLAEKVRAAQASGLGCVVVPGGCGEVGTGLRELYTLDELVGTT